tara:strand:+ start:1436 stop:1795 length:360 start_codon:yes stop_codon:yes gene_type:complete
MVYKKIYIYFGLLVFLIGQPLMFFDVKASSTIFLGMLAPMAMSYINILIITKLTKERGSLVTFGFNVIQFIIKTIFLCAITYIGVKVIGLNFKVFIPVLCFTWFIFHILEGLYTNSLIK